MQPSGVYITSGIITPERRNLLRKTIIASVPFTAFRCFLIAGMIRLHKIMKRYTHSGISGFRILVHAVQYGSYGKCYLPPILLPNQFHNPQYGVPGSHLIFHKHNPLCFIYHLVQIRPDQFLLRGMAMGLGKI